MMSESEYISRLSEGSVEAFDYLYLRYSPLVEKFAYSLMKDRHQADDLCQNVFLKIWNNRSSLADVRSFKSYLFIMARNAIYDEFARCTTELIPDNELIGFQAPDIEAEIEANDLRMLINVAVSSMSPRRAEIFRLSRVKGLKNKEIARKLGISVKTVEYHMSKALKELDGLIKVILLFF